MTPGVRGERGLDRERLALEVRRARKPFLVLVAFIVLAFVAATEIFRNTGVSLPWQGTYTTQVAIDDVSGLRSGAHKVRLKGVEVGRVGKIELNGSQALVTINIDDEYGPLYQDARLRLRPDTPLVDLYLNIEDRGAPSAGELGEDDVLAADRTRRFVDIGRVLNVFGDETNARVEQAIDELGRGLPDRGRELRATLVELAPFLRAAKRLTRQTAVRRAQTRRVVHNFRLMTEELARRDQDLRQLVRGGAQSLTEIGSREDSLERVIAELPPTMRQLRSSFGTVRSAADDLDAAFDALRPVAHALPAGLDALRRFSESAEPSFEALRGSLPGLTALVRAARPTADDLAVGFERLQPVAPRLDRITGLVTPCEDALQKFFTNTVSLGKFYDRYAVTIRGQTVLAGGATPQPNQTASPSCAPGGPR